MKYLIVNADDFGLTSSINKGIVKACEEGIVTAVSLLATGEALEHALECIKEISLKEIGAHLSLTEGRPSTDPDKIPTLITKSGLFHKNYKWFYAGLLLGTISHDEIYIELKNQLNIFKNIGIDITNLSSHQHIHMIPEVLDIFVHLAKEYGIKAIRYPHGDRHISKFNIDRFYRALVLAHFGGRMGNTFEKSGIVHTDNFLGLLDSGKLSENTLIDMIMSLRDGATELICHPGFLGPEILDRYPWHINCEEELFALTSRRVKRLIEDKNIKLATYREFLSKK